MNDAAKVPVHLPVLMLLRTQMDSALRVELDGSPATTLAAREVHEYQLAMIAALIARSHHKALEGYRDSERSGISLESRVAKFLHHPGVAETVGSLRSRIQEADEIVDMFLDLPGNQADVCQVIFRNIYLFPLVVGIDPKRFNDTTVIPLRVEIYRKVTSRTMSLDSADYLVLIKKLADSLIPVWRTLDRREPRIRWLRRVGWKIVALVFAQLRNGVVAQYRIARTRTREMLLLEWRELRYPISLAASCDSYHLSMEGPPGTYLAIGELVERPSPQAPLTQTAAHVRPWHEVTSPTGQRTAHFYARGVTDMQAHKFAFRVRFAERGLGSVAVASVLALGSAVVSTVVGKALLESWESDGHRGLSNTVTWAAPAELGLLLAVLTAGTFLGTPAVWQGRLTSRVIVVLSTGVNAFAFACAGIPTWLGVDTLKSTWHGIVLILFTLATLGATLAITGGIRYVWAVQRADGE